MFCLDVVSGRWQVDTTTSDCYSLYWPQSEHVEHKVTCWFPRQQSTYARRWKCTYLNSDCNVIQGTIGIIISKCFYFIYFVSYDMC